MPVRVALVSPVVARCVLKLLHGAGGNHVLRTSVHVASRNQHRYKYGPWLPADVQQPQHTHRPPPRYRPILALRGRGPSGTGTDDTKQSISRWCAVRTRHEDRTTTRSSWPRAPKRFRCSLRTDPLPVPPAAGSAAATSNVWTPRRLPLPLPCGCATLLAAGKNVAPWIVHTAPADMMDEPGLRDERIRTLCGGRK